MRKALHIFVALLPLVVAVVLASCAHVRRAVVAASDCNGVQAGQDVAAAVHSGGHDLAELLTAIVSGARAAVCIEEEVRAHWADDAKCATNDPTCGAPSALERARGELVMAAHRAKVLE